MIGLPDMYAQSTGATGLMTEGEHIRQTTRAHVTNTFTRKSKGIQRVTYLMLPWFEGHYRDVALRLCYSLYIYNKG